MPNNISPNWKQEIQDTAWGSIFPINTDNDSKRLVLQDLADSSTIGPIKFGNFGIEEVDEKWYQMKNLMDKSVKANKTFTNDIVSTYSLPYTTASAYYGGVLAPNGDIHFVPFSANRGQKVNAYTGAVSTYALAHTSAAGNRYAGGVLNAYGEVIFFPYRAPVAQKVNLAGVVSTYAIPITDPNGLSKGGVMDTDGNIFILPVGNSLGLVMYRGTSIFSTYQILNNNYGFQEGCVLSPNGDVHLLAGSTVSSANPPQTSKKISKNNIYSTFNLIAKIPSNANYWNGGVLNSNGDIHFVPGYSNPGIGQKISLNGQVNTYTIPYASMFYNGGVLAPNGDIHFVPSSASAFGMKVSLDDKITTYSLTYTGGNYYGGVLTPNGDIHFIPLDASVGMKVSTLPAEPFDSSVCLSPFLNKL